MTIDNPPVVVKVAQRRTDGDCAIVALAQFLGLTYEDALEAMVSVADGAHRDGVYVTKLIEAAERLSAPLKRKRKFDADEAHGILLLKCTKNRYDTGHVALLRWGLVFDHQKNGFGEVWEYADFMKHYGAKAVGILVRTE